ncbi:MAG: alkaline phosphatase family protein [Candidatus Eremiobacteraeota bacterium]|nr:alkaline phosphatase family protein [Candidatus Eremiobacteraeota bacterium]MBV8366404.1 alkaline phosphatase family protein [Candidatus Eremiobacteraeota bacterium]
MNRGRAIVLAMCSALVALGTLTGDRPATALAAARPPGIDKIDHVIVIYQENWSYDGLYGKFPGSNNLASAGAITQLDKDGKPLTSVPQPLVNGTPDPRFPATLPVAAYDVNSYVKPDQTTGDLIHRFYHEQLQIDGGKMDKFVAWSDNGGLVLSYYDASSMPEGKLAAEFVMSDNFFHSAFGGSFANHFFLVCACMPTWPNAPASFVSNPDANNLADKQVTPDGYAVNTAYTVNNPHPATVTDPAQLVPNQTMPTIGDRLSAAGVSWAWYAGGWNDALAGHPDKLFQFHHQPFAYFANYADGTSGKKEHLKDESEFFAAIASKQLPAVSFIKPLGPDNEHPGYANLQRGQQHVADIVKAIRTSPYWNDSVIIITYDENGGRWDHVAPPVIDRWGPGTRVPTIIVSPYAKHNYVDHTQYETVSILSFIEARWRLRPLGSRDANANPLANAFDFSQAVQP